jgi:SecD/SecF fusion protein
MSNYRPLLGKRIGSFAFVAMLGLAILSVTPIMAADPPASDPPAAEIVAPSVIAGQVVENTDESARLVFQVDDGGEKDAEKLAITVFYGTKEAGEVEADWESSTKDAIKDRTKGSEYYTATIKGLEPETTYFYRILATNPAGSSWSKSVEFETPVPSQPAYILFGYFLIIMAVFIVPFWVGGAFARKVKMPDYGWKVGLIIFSLVAGALIIATGWPPKLGIDLSGGVILVYELDDDATHLQQAKAAQPKEGEAPVQKKSVDMEKLISAIQLRVNPGGQREVSIRQYGPKQIEITIPRASEDEVRRLENNVSRAGTLEFRILANNRDHKELIQLAKETKSNEIFNNNKTLEAWWVPVSASSDGGFLNYSEIATRTIKRGDKDVVQVLVVKDPFDVTGGYLQNCLPTNDEHGRPAVSFSFNTSGARRFGGLTSNNLPIGIDGGFTRKLGIILDGHLYSAPSIQSTIHDQGIISGNFTPEAVEDLVDVLNAGSLPAALKKNPISKLATGPTLGADMIQRGKWAIIGSLIAVLFFMLFYYRFSGIIACCALITNLVLLFAIMIAVKADFTLPGLAGLVLTVGMAVDANVLIFERIREELGKNAALRMAIRNGFSRATTAIVDANLTTLITALVLWVVGTPQIKGFAVVLILGVLLSMFTAIFCARVVFDIGERRGWIKRLTMTQVLGKTNIDFIGMQKVGAVFSIILIVVGMVCVGARGTGILDIDFTGGESIEILFKEPVKTAEVRSTLKDLQDLTVNDVQIQGEKAGIRYIINTAEQIDPNDEKNKGKSATDVIEGIIFEKFGEKLETNELVNFKATPISDAKPAEDKKPAAKKPAENSQSRTDLPSENLVASTDLSFLLFAQADDRFAGGSQVTMDFVRPIDQERLSEWIHDILAKENLTKAAYELTNDEYEPGDSESYANWTLLVDLPQAEVEAKLITPLKAHLAAAPFFPSSSSIGGRVASDMQEKAILALMGSLICIIGYLWIRFQRVMFGLSAVVALVHDVLITLGAIAASAYLANAFGWLLIDEFKISLSVLAAFLTIIGYSLNDTIVVFDRIREVRGKSPHLSADMINTSINQTLSRTFLTSLTTLIGVIILYFAGGQGIHAFAFALLIGVIIGTYSSIFVASPALLWMSRSKTLGTGPAPMINVNKNGGGKGKGKGKGK